MEVFGESFRVVVFDSKPFLVQRNPRPSVTGDGERTIRELMAEASEQSLVSETYFQMTFDLEKACNNADMKRTLQRQGLTLDTVLAEGQHAFLMQGGRVTDFGSRLEFHPPDFMSKKTEEVVMKVLNLVQMSEASVDFIGGELSLPDPDFIICEVNAGPAFTFPPEKAFLRKIADYIAESVNGS